MQGRTFVAAIAAVVVGALGAGASAQTTGSQLESAGTPAAAPTTATGAPAAATPPASAMTATGTPAGSTSAAPASDASPKTPARPATGYGFGDAKPAKTAAPVHHAASAHRSGAPIVMLPGFEMLADGGSRLFVQVSKTIEVTEAKGTSQPARGKKAKATDVHPTLTYVLKGAQILKRNNENALVTVHFNTPVAKARLYPAGRDVRFVVDLRAATAPTFKVVAAKENSAILQIDFPKGDFLPAGAADAPDPVAPEGPKVMDGADTR